MFCEEQFRYVVEIPEDIMIDKKTIAADERLRQEFNQWAEQGRGEEMENHHISITEQTLALMELKPGDRVLDLGCGAGWASRLMARAVAHGDKPGQVIGLDVSDEMIRRARAGSKEYDNVMFVVGSAQQIPWEENFFEKVLSVESLLLLRRSGSRAGRTVPRDGAAGRAVYPDQSLQGQSLFVALGRRAEGTGASALGARVRSSC